MILSANKETIMMPFKYALQLRTEKALVTEIQDRIFILNIVPFLFCGLFTEIVLLQNILVIVKFEKCVFESM